MTAVRKRAPRKLAQDVVQAVDRLHGRRRILESRLGQRPLGDVDEQPNAVRDVLVECRLEGEDERLPEPILVEPGRAAVDAEERRAGGDELAECGNELQPAAGTARFLDQLLDADAGEDT